MARWQSPFPIGVLPLAVLAAGALSACDAGGAGGRADEAPPRCRPGPGATGRPTSIDEALTLVNSLPRPTTITCFLESLDRPLPVLATVSTISLQPAVGRRSPRLFLLVDKLVMSVVVEGEGRDLVEFGEFVTATRTLKGEIGFPSAAALPPSAPYERIRSDNPMTGKMGTSCRFCHGDEQRAVQIGDAVAYTSSALRPDYRSEIPLAEVRREREICDRTAEPDRCDFLRALFDHGALVETPFPNVVPSIVR